MMNVKKYRAATTREALEQVKQDLGEEAFVLETKQIRAGGFLGFKAGTQIEISAALPPSSLAAQPMVKHRAAKFSATSQMLSLTDDAPAAPQTSRDVKGERTNILAALSSRAALSDKFENSVGSAFGTERREIEAVELSEIAPRIVHPKKEVVKQILPEQNAAPIETAAIEDCPAVVSSRDFEILRAELREVKFSLGAFAFRQNVPVWEDNVGFEDFGEVFDAPFYDSYIDLTATGISPELARQIITKIIPYYKKGFVKAEQLTRHALLQALSSRIKFESNLLAQEKPAVIAVIGATGVGKTTTIAKIAARVALHERRPVELITLDTYRIAAVEQLKTYAEIIGAGCHIVRSVLELEAVLQRIPADTTVLIDTTGKNPHDLADQFEFSDYLRQHPEIRKCLAVQATIHPDDGIAAIKKFEMYGADCLALTKLDETMRPGATIELAAESSLPLAFFCAGQRVPEDLQIATPDGFTAQILRQKR